jgi:hypothetical protein
MGTVQGLELLLLSVGVLVAVAYLATELRKPTDHVVWRVLLGLVPAVIAIALVVFNRLDVVPDDIEQPAWIVAVVIVTGLLIAGTTYRLARR